MYSTSQRKQKRPREGEASPTSSLPKISHTASSKLANQQPVQPLPSFASIPLKAAAASGSAALSFGISLKSSVPRKRVPPTNPTLPTKSTPSIAAAAVQDHAGAAPPRPMPSPWASLLPAQDGAAAAGAAGIRATAAAAARLAPGQALLMLLPTLPGKGCLGGGVMLASPPHHAPGMGASSVAPMCILPPSTSVTTHTTPAVVRFTAPPLPKEVRGGVGCNIAGTLAGAAGSNASSSYTNHTLQLGVSDTGDAQWQPCPGTSARASATPPIAPPVLIAAAGRSRGGAKAPPQLHFALLAPTSFEPSAQVTVALLTASPRAAAAGPAEGGHAAVTPPLTAPCIALPIISTAGSQHSAGVSSSADTAPIASSIDSADGTEGVDGGKGEGDLGHVASLCWTADSEREALLRFAGIPQLVPGTLQRIAAGTRAATFRAEVMAQPEGTADANEKPAFCVLKVQPWDTRVAAEVVVCSTGCGTDFLGSLCAEHGGRLFNILCCKFAGEPLDAILSSLPQHKLPLDVTLRLAHALVKQLSQLHGGGAAAGGVVWGGPSSLHYAYLHSDIHSGNVCVPQLNAEQHGTHGSAPEHAPPQSATGAGVAAGQYDWTNARLIDFGSARPLTSVQPVSAEPDGHQLCSDCNAPHGQYVGKPRGGLWHSVPMEYFNSQSVFRAESDLFCLAALIVTCATGSPPFAPPPGRKLTFRGATTHPRRQEHRLRTFLQRVFPHAVGSVLSAMLAPCPAQRLRCAGAAGRLLPHSAVGSDNSDSVLPAAGPRFDGVLPQSHTAASKAPLAQQWGGDGAQRWGPRL